MDFMMDTQTQECTQNHIPLHDDKHKLVKLSNRARYILGNLDGSIDLRRKTNDAVVSLLESRGFDRLDGDYKYLTKMPMDSVTQENVDAIMKEKADTEHELDTLKATSCETMWMRELVNFETEYAKYKAHREAIQNPAPAEGKGSEGKKKVTKVIKKVVSKPAK